MRKLTLQENLQRQNQASQTPRCRLTVVLNDIRSLHNVGAIFRTADGAGVEKVWLCGITGSPPQSAIHKTALGAEGRVPWEYAKDVIGVIQGLKRDGYEIVVLEQTDESQEYVRFQPRRPVALVVGHEITGVDERLVALADVALEIPMGGVKNSLNVSVAFGIAAYHIRAGLFKIIPEG